MRHVVYSKVYNMQSVHTQGLFSPDDEWTRRSAGGQHIYSRSKPLLLLGESWRPPNEKVHLILQGVREIEFYVFSRI